MTKLITFNYLQQKNKTKQNENTVNKQGRSQFTQIPHTMPRCWVKTLPLNNFPLNLVRQEF